jgi:hypothetical protein
MRRGDTYIPRGTHHCQEDGSFTICVDWLESRAIYFRCSWYCRSRSRADLVFVLGGVLLEIWIGQIPSALNAYSNLFSVPPAAHFSVFAVIHFKRSL